MLVYLPSERESEQLAMRLADSLVLPLIITFSGDIGVGKTTLIRALLRSLGVSCSIKSPTFSLVESYDISFQPKNTLGFVDNSELDIVEMNSQQALFKARNNPLFDKIQFHHFDLYRIMDETELELIGFRDYFGEQSICCIEWPERVSYSLERIDLSFTLTHCNDGRDLQIQSFSSIGNSVLSCLESNA